MTAIIGLLMGPLGRYVAMVAAGMALFAGALLALNRHDAALERRWMERQAAAVAKAQDDARALADAAAAAAEARVRAAVAADATIARKIDHAPDTTACLASPAVRALLGVQ